MTPAERAEYDRAVEWASFAESFGTETETPTTLPASDEVTGTRIPRNHVDSPLKPTRGFEPRTPSLRVMCSTN